MTEKANTRVVALTWIAFGVDNAAKDVNAMIAHILHRRDTGKMTDAEAYDALSKVDGVYDLRLLPQ